MGTSSLRRRAFIARLRPDIELLELRGNVPTRIERMKNGDYDAIILAAAGLRRLELDQHISELLSDGRVSAGRFAGRHWCLHADRAMPRRGVGCGRSTIARRGWRRRPSGRCCEGSRADVRFRWAPLATLDGDTLRLHAVVCSLDGKKSIQAKSQIAASLENATSLGQQVADDLLSQGAAGLMANERTARSLATGG